MTLTGQAAAAYAAARGIEATDTVVVEETDRHTIGYMLQDTAQAVESLRAQGRVPEDEEEAGVCFARCRRATLYQRQFPGNAWYLWVAMIGDHAQIRSPRIGDDDDSYRTDRKSSTS